MQKTKENKTDSISPEAIIALSDEFDNYDITDHLNESKPVDFEVNITRRNFRLEKSLAEKIFKISQKRGISPETYINLVLQEKILEETDDLIH
jgi:predicted DNA binding CopG/RHH family protein